MSRFLCQKYWRFSINTESDALKRISQNISKYFPREYSSQIEGYDKRQWTVKSELPIKTLFSIVITFARRREYLI